MVRLVLLLITYSAAQIAAGHGIAPVGFLLILGGSYWAAGQVFGWLGIVVGFLSMSYFMSDKLLQSAIRLTAMLLMYYSWFLFASTAARQPNYWGDLGMLFLLSSPFQLCFLIIIIYTARELIKLTKKTGSENTELE